MLAIKVIRFVDALPKAPAADIIGRQLVKSGTSVGANCREADKAESKRDFIHKIALASKECAETQYWLELAEAVGLGEPKIRRWLSRESTELLAILVTIGQTAKRRRKQAGE
jgi:four helix bundle protein